MLKKPTVNQPYIELPLASRVHISRVGDIQRTVNNRKIEIVSFVVQFRY